jgi:hypothetical protein
MSWCKTHLLDPLSLTVMAWWWWNGTELMRFVTRMLAREQTCLRHLQESCWYYIHEKWYFTNVLIGQTILFLSLYLSWSFCQQNDTLCKDLIFFPYSVQTSPWFRHGTGRDFTLTFPVQRKYIIFEVIPSVMLNFQVFWDVISCDGKSKVHPCTGTEALYRPYGRRRSRGIALFFHGHGTRRRWGVSVTPRPLFTPGKDPIPIVQEAG